jgi:predicted DsbA family dithiol-disulfide isomerase
LAIKILGDLGEKQEKIKEAINSNWVKERVMSAKKKSLKYKISTVPTFIVNEKYLLKRSSFNKDEHLFKEILSLSK